MEDRLDEDRPGFAVAAIRAAVLDGSIYRGLNEAPEHMLRALGVVLLVALAFGVGVQNTLPVSDEGPRWLAVLIPASTTVIGWIVWSYTAFGVNALMLGAQATSSRLLQRGIGLAHAPGVMLVFTGLPITLGLPEGVSFIYLFVTMTWMLLAAVVAVREIQGEGWVKAIIPTAVGWLVGQFVLRIVIFRLLTDQGA